MQEMKIVHKVDCPQCGAKAGTKCEITVQAGKPLLERVHPMRRIAYAATIGTKEK